MKKKIFVSALLTANLFFIGSNSFSVTPVSPAELTPAEATQFIKISDIQKCITGLETVLKYFNNIERIKTANEFLKELKAKTGTDFLNTSSLKKSGFDIKRPLCIASITEEPDKETMIYYFPVSDEKKFGSLLLKTIRQSDTEKKEAAEPVIIKYNDFKILQLNNIFYCYIENYLVVTSSENIIKKIIDLKANPETNLLQNKSYKNYKVNFEDKYNNLINIYLTKNAIESFYKPGIQQIPVNTKRNDQADKNQETLNNPANNNTKPGISQKPNNINVNFIDYAALGLRYSDDSISLTALVAANADDVNSKPFTDIFISGKSTSSINIDSPVLYYFSAIDSQAYNNFKKLIALNTKSEKNYKNAQNTLSNILFFGADRDKLMQCYDNILNIALTKSSGDSESFIISLPLKESKDNADTWDKLKSSYEKKYAGNEKFGEQKIEITKTQNTGKEIITLESFWHLDEKGNKINYIINNNNLYISNNIDTIKKIIAAPQKELSETKNTILKEMDKSVFFFSYINIKEESLIKAIITMMVYYINPELYNFINKVDHALCTGKKIDNNILLNIDMRLLSNKSDNNKK